MSWLANRLSPLLLIPFFLSALTLSLATPAEAVIHIGSPNTAALTNGLVAYWPLDGAVTDWKSGTTEDIIGGNNGTLVNMSTSTSPVAGKIGQALNFVAARKSHVDAGAPSSLSLTGDMSIAAWFKYLPTGSQSGAIVTNLDNSVDNEQYGLYFGRDEAEDCTNGLCFEVTQGFGSVSWHTPNDILSPGKWYHVVVTRQGVANIHIYLNGASQTVTFAGGTPSVPSSAGNTLIGDDGVDFLPTDGSIDDVRVYNRALGADEIQQLYSLGRANSTNYLTPFRWTIRTNAGFRHWNSITSSSDGMKLAAASGGDIYTSTNQGASWTDQTAAGSRTWAAITSSSDGKKLAAAARGGDIYTSADGGVTWTDQTAPGSRLWHTITSSSDGTKLAAGVGLATTGDIYTSTDSGLTWTDQTAAGTRDWRSITSSSDGTKLAAAATGPDDIYTSTDSGVTWTDQTGAGTRNWRVITSSANGTKLAAAVQSGDIYTSTDGGVTWTDQTAAGSRLWNAITSSSDGTKLAAGDGKGTGGDIYTSTDGGVTWTDQTAARKLPWDSITSSSDGSRSAACWDVASFPAATPVTGTTRGTVALGHSNIINGNGLVGYWTFDGPNTHWNTGTTDDVSGNGNTGQLIGMSTSTSPVAGKIGQALKFIKPSNNYIDIGSSALLQPTAAVSASAWAYSDGTLAPLVISSQTPVNTGGYGLYLNTGPNMIFYIDTDGMGTYAIAAANSPIQSGWHFYMGTWDGSTVKLYVDGVLQSTTASASAINYDGFHIGTVDAGIGGSSENTAWHGGIDDVIYNRALGAQEIQQLYNAGR